MNRDVTITDIRCPRAAEHKAEAHVNLRRRADGTQFCALHGDSDLHASATHVDAHGMPVAFYDDGDGPRPYHPTPCCGAAASISDGPMYCKACFREVDDLYGGVPAAPFKAVAA